MNKSSLLIVIALAATLVIVAVGVPDAAIASLVTVLSGGAALLVFRHFSDDKQFITKVFLAGLAVRIVFGFIVHFFDLREFFGGDANTYDNVGNRLMEIWSGRSAVDDSLTRSAQATTGAGWGMHYLVGALYFLVGRNILAAQSLCGVIGAATAPMVYLCARKIFHNVRVAKFSALSIALFPSFIIWSSQLLKDGLVIFLLVLAMTMVLQLQEKFNYAAVIVLVLSLFGIMSLRFYIFYMVIAAVVGSFLIGTATTFPSVVRRSIVLVIMGLGLTYFGVIRTATVDLDTYGNLEAVQRSRSDLATSAKSGFGAEADVSTTDGAISTLPIGFAYLMLAPFPWQMSSLRQSITLPEVLLWWALIPVMISGLIYAFKNKLRKAAPILIFSIMLTLSYSIFQGNVGTAYRQRTQIQVFLFMFIAVGWVLYKEKRENQQLVMKRKREMIDAALKGRVTS
ncbi:MAG: glycosyltransferase family 39 protein [Blastocatellia bacterium]|nr:glycosyltransferase family 39 protein [Blastocatellia bacterium]